MSFPRYPEYKASGVEWLGDVPEHWGVSPIGYFTNKIGSGKTPKGGAESYYEEGVMLIRSQNVHDNGLRLSDVVFIDDKTDEEMANTRVKPRDVLLNITGASLGRCCIVPNYINSANVNQHVCIIRTQVDILLPEFAQLSLLSDMIKSQIFADEVGSSREGLNFQQIKQLLITLPSISEQQAIADFLDRETAKIDGLIEEQRRLVELLKEKRQAVISHAVTKGLNPNAPMKPSGIEWLGDIPEHWEVFRMASLYQDTKEAGDDSLPVLSVSIHNGVSDREFDENELERKVARSEDKSKYVKVIPNDLVYNMMRAWQGGFGTVKVSGMVSPAYVVARPRLKIQTQFVEFMLRTAPAIEEMRRFSQGVTDFRLRLYWDKFKSMYIALPSAIEQQRICTYIENVIGSYEQLSAEAEKSITLLQERRTALISAAVTGKIDVRGLIQVESKS